MSWQAGLKGQRVDPNSLNPYYEAPLKTEEQAKAESKEGWKALKNYMLRLAAAGGR